MSISETVAQQIARAATIRKPRPYRCQNCGRSRPGNPCRVCGQQR